jgi:hypothetical protein
MPISNLSLGNLFRATTGAARTTQAVSLNAMNASAGTSAAIRDFAIDSITVTPPTFTYIVEATTETATFSFASAGNKHGTRVGSVAANYSVTFNNANFSVGTPTLGASPSFPITPAAINASTYSEASSSLSMNYADGFNLAATNYNTTVTKLLYAVDVYNTINEPDFCLVFGTKVQLANGTEINVEDLEVGDQIKAWVPAGLPDENLDPESDEVDWRFYLSNILNGEAQIVTVNDLTYNFAEGYFSLNNGLIKATETHPLYVWDNEIEQYKFKNVGDILPGDRLIKYTEENGEEEIEITDIELVRQVSEIVTLNVENADVYISNGLISHNKGTATQPYIPSSGLRMYLDPGKARSFPANALPSTGTPTSDWLDLTGWGTGVRPAGVSNQVSITGGNPSYNNGATKKDEYWSLDTNKFWYKDGTSNINGGYTQFNTSAYTVVAWVRFPSHPANTWNNFFNKQDNGVTRLISLYVNSNGSGTYYIHDGTSVQANSDTFSLSTNVWYMVSYTAALNGTNVFYLDKTSRGSKANGSLDYTSSGLITIGYNFRETAYPFTGQIGPVLFYNRQLNSTEIGQVYDYFSPTYK